MAILKSLIHRFLGRPGPGYVQCHVCGAYVIDEMYEPHVYTYHKK